MSRRHDNHQRGFTLIELLVVIVILGILAAVVVFAVRGSGDKGKGAAVATDERIIRTALELYCARNGHYPEPKPAATRAPTDPQSPMEVLVAEKFLSSPSQYHTLQTGDGLPQGNCPGIGPKSYQLIGPPTISRLLPAPIDAGQSHSLALKNGTVWTFGGNYYGQLGNGSYSGTGDYSPRGPAQVIDPTLTDPNRLLSGVTAVASGGIFSLALKRDSTVWDWGYNGEGELGDGTTNWSGKPVQVVQAPAPASPSTTVPVIGGLPPTTAPSNPITLSGVIAISAGGSYRGHSVALKGDGTVWAWGANQRGELGNGLTINSSIAVQVSNLSGVIAISAGDKHSLALKGDGTVWAWGYNGDGELGNGTTTWNSTLKPVQVSNLSGVPVIAISAGGDVGTGHSLALKGDGTVWAWGSNYKGQLGDGTTNTSPTPVKVTNLSGVTAIAAGGEHSLALKDTGAVVAWGLGNSGQLGNVQPGSPFPPCCDYQSSTPVPVTVVSGVTAIAAGDNHSLALNGDGWVWGWGANGQRQLGNPGNGSPWPVKSEMKLA